jgi:hypothetical protein
VFRTRLSLKSTLAASDSIRLASACVSMLVRETSVHEPLQDLIVQRVPLGLAAVRVRGRALPHRG